MAPLHRLKGYDKSYVEVDLWLTFTSAAPSVAGDPIFMLLPSVQDASKPAFSMTAQSASEAEPIHHLLLGSLGAVRVAIKDLHRRSYADSTEWSAPISVGRTNEVIAILKRRSPVPLASPLSTRSEN